MCVHHITSWKRFDIIHIRVTTSHSPNLLYNCREGQMFRKFFQFILVDVWSNQCIEIQIRWCLNQFQTRRTIQYSISPCLDKHHSEHLASLLWYDDALIVMDIFSSSKQNWLPRARDTKSGQSQSQSLVIQVSKSRVRRGVTTALWCRRRGNELISEVITFIKTRTNCGISFNKPGQTRTKYDLYTNPVFLCHLEMFIIFSSPQV